MLTQPAKSPLPLTQLALYAQLSSRHPPDTLTSLKCPFLQPRCLPALCRYSQHTLNVNHAIHIDGDDKRTASMASSGEADLVCVGTTRGAYVHTYIGETVDVCTGYHSGGVGGRPNSPLKILIPCTHTYIPHRQSHHTLTQNTTASTHVRT